MATCDTIEVDLTPVNFDVTICQTAYDVEIIQPNVTLDAVSIAGQGPKGDQGEQGIPGPVGPMGPAGIGPQGPQGVPGPPGQDSTIAGPAGPMGPAGSPGNPGNPGAAATIAIGSTTTGTPGTPANVTNIGDSSAAVFNFTIPAGVQGTAGAPGAAGATGPQGNPGATGPQGNPGATGPQGNPGATGTAATIAVGTTTTGAAGSNAAVTNTGTSAAAVFNFTVPQGIQGTAGAPGTPGVNSLATTTANGLLKQVSGLATDFVDGTNNCQNLVTAVQPTIWSVCLRAFNSVGNPNFEVDQVNCGTQRNSVPTATKMLDRWIWGRAGSHQINSQQINASVVLPGTNFWITQYFLRLTLATGQATLAAGDYGYFYQFVEGPQLREIFNDVHSVSILIRSTKANHKFSYLINDPSGSRSFTKVCTIPSANTWTLITIPNIPAFPSAGTWSMLPGAFGATEGFSFGAGTTFTSSTDGVWVTGQSLAAPGTDNWFSNAISTTTVDIAFIQHEPGPVCSTLQDKTFTQNLDECQRYYQKSYPYPTAIGSVTANGSGFCLIPASQWVITPIFFKKTMAKIPTIAGFSTATGAGANVRDDTAASDRAISGYQSVGDSGFGGFSITTVNAAPASYHFHYIADTGW